MSAHMRHISIIAALAATLICLAGCRMEGPEQRINAPEYQVHFVARDIQTRTVFKAAQQDGDDIRYPVVWTGREDKIAVSLNFSEPQEAAVTPSASGSSAEFDASFSASGQQAPYVFYALSPLSASLGSSSSQGGYLLNIPAKQTPVDGSCDEAAMILAASSTADSPSAFSSVDLHFSHVTAYGKLTLKNLSLPGDADIQSVDITAEAPISGQFYYNYDSGLLTDYAASRSLTVNAGSLALTANGDKFDMADIWFACAPADVSGGDLCVTLNTSIGKFTRTVSIPKGKLSFSAGRISKFTVDMADADFEQVADRWILVTDASTLAAGDEIIIASSATAGSAYAVSTTQTTSGTPSRNGISVTIARDSDGKMIVAYPDSNVETFTLLAGAYSGTFYLKEATSASGRYLYASTTGTSNSLNSSETITSSIQDYASWVISTASGNSSVISTYGTVSFGSINYYRHMRLNGTEFRTYRSSSQTIWKGTTSGTADVFIYRKGPGTDSSYDPMMEYEVYGAYLSDGNRLYQAGKQLSRENQGDGTVTFAIISPASFEVDEFIGIPTAPAKGDSFTLTYNRITGNDQTDTDYNVTVVQVDGPKVWLSTGTGYGFIVKK